jgi:hypothetical protein
VFREAFGDGRQWGALTRRFGARGSRLLLHPLLVRRATAFCVAAGLLTWLALSGAGYDLVLRQEVGLAVWALIAVGFALGALPRCRPERATIVPLLCGLGLILWMLLSLTWTESDERTTAEIARVLTFAGLIVLVFCALNRHTFRAAAAGLSAATLGIAGVAVASRLDPSLFPGAAEVARAFKTDRLNYPLDYWNAVGAWGAMAVAVGLAWSAHARFAVTRALALAAVPVAGLAVYFSYSRGGVIGTAVAVLAVLALSRNRWTALLHLFAAAAGATLAISVARGHDQIVHASGGEGGSAVALALVVAAAVCVGAVYVTTTLDSDHVQLYATNAEWASFVGITLLVVVIAGSGPISRAWDQFNNKDQVTSGQDPAGRLTSAGGTRKNLWDSAIDAFKAHPLDGIGPGTYEFLWARDARDPEFVRDAHSLYLEQGAELGLPGLLLLVGVFGGLLAVALRARESLREPGDMGASVALTAAFLVFAVSAGFDWIWEETAVAALALGGLAAAGAGGSERLRTQQRRGQLRHPGIRAGVVALALSAAMFEVPGIVATQRTRASQQAMRAGDLIIARRLAQAGVDAEPWAATPRFQLGLVLEREDRLREARRNVRGAVMREPTNWRYPLVLARLDVALGDRDRGQRVFRQGSRLTRYYPYYSPYSPFASDVFTLRQLRRTALRQFRQQATTRP